MKVVVDVDYRDSDSYAVASAVVFKDWTDGKPLGVESVEIRPVAPYEPGAFYKRELPCLLKLLTVVSARYPDPIDTVIVDGYVWLGPNHPGLGCKLYEALNQKIPVVGVAKTYFKGSDASQVLRGQSQSPLYVTAAGIDPNVAADHVRKMHGEFRLPTLVKLVDQSCRTATVTT